MSKFFVIVFSSSLLLLTDVTGINPSPDKNKNILVLFSLVPSTPAYRYLEDGLRKKLSEQFGDSYTLHMEYLETERFPKGEYPKERFDLYNEKYRNEKLDLLICVGRNIVNLMKKDADSHLLGLPAISLDFDLSNYGIVSDLTINNKTVVMGLKFDATSTIKEALTIFPDIRSIYFISGASEADKIFKMISSEETRKIPGNIKVTFLQDMSMDVVLDSVKKLHGDALIIISSFFTDSNNVPYFNPESVRIISGVSDLPVFTFSDMGLGEGSFGGKILSFKKAGILLGETAVKILNGTDPASIKYDPFEFYDYILDWHELVRWNQTGLEKRRPGCTILNRDESFLGKHKWLITAGVFFLILQSFLLVTLIQLYRKQKMMTRQIVETDRKYMDIIREDRLLRMGMLTASLSHELNQPLTAILSTAQAGKRFVEANNSDPALLKEIFDNIVDDNNRAASILKSIKGLMKLENREKERVNLNDLITEVAELYRSKAIELNSKLRLYLSEKPVYIIADSIQIQQVLLNLISNASHSTVNTGIEYMTIDIYETIENYDVTVTVRDYGKGIDEKIHKRLFEPFVTSRDEGSGIGLNISRLIIENHQGKIWARNMPERGAEFSFKLKISDETGS